MIELTPEQKQFIDAQVATGSFKDSTEVVQAGIDLLREAAELRKAAEQRESGETVDDIRQGHLDIEAGKGQVVEEAFADVRKKLGLPA